LCSGRSIAAPHITSQRAIGGNVELLYIVGDHEFLALANEFSTSRT
jgi:hypothetical protein